MNWFKRVGAISALIVGIAGSTPTIMEAYSSVRLGVGYGDSDVAEEQLVAFKNNFECMTNAEFTTLQNAHGIEVGSTVCPSGDILVMGITPNSQHPIYKWVTLDNLLGEDFSVLNILGIATAHAQPDFNNPNYPVQVLCQKWVDNIYFVQRVTTTTGCWDLTIDGRTGAVVAYQEAYCSCSQF